MDENFSKANIYLNVIDSIHKSLDFKFDSGLIDSLEIEEELLTAYRIVVVNSGETLNHEALLLPYQSWSRSINGARHYLSLKTESNKEQTFLIEADIKGFDLMATILPEIRKIKQFFNETLLPIANNNPTKFSIRNLENMEVKVYYQMKSKLKELEYLDHLHPEEEVISLQILEIKSVKKI